MQVLPRFVSVDENGNEYEFLIDFFTDKYEALSAVFLKGYQWPFDSKKVLEGSSIIDLLVYRECVLKSRRVYLDFTKNPFDTENIEYKKLSTEAFEYLSKAEACFGTPIERLNKMNSPAVELYKNKGVDISKEYLEIALCAQHNNGGIAVDMWWQTSIKGLFAAGECAGTHGITRPGGSALNAGQVGSLRAAQYISKNGHSFICSEIFESILSKAEDAHKKQLDKVIKIYDNLDELIEKGQRRMSDNASAIRNKANLEKALRETEKDLNALCDNAGIIEKSKLYRYYKLKDILVTGQAVLTAMLDYADTVGETRGSSLCYDEKGQLRSGLEEIFRFTEERRNTHAMVQETMLSGDKFICRWRNVRPIPQNSDFFENVWRRYRENMNVY